RFFKMLVLRLLRRCITLPSDLSVRSPFAGYVALQKRTSPMSFLSTQAHGESLEGFLIGKEASQVFGQLGITRQQLGHGARLALSLIVKVLAKYLVEATTLVPLFGSMSHGSLIGCPAAVAAMSEARAATSQQLPP